MATEAQKLAHRLGQEFQRLYPDQAAAELERLSMEEVVRFLEELPAARSRGTAEPTEPGHGRPCCGQDGPLRGGEDRRGTGPASGGSPAGAPGGGPRDELLACLNTRDAAELRQLISYPPHTAGALMDPQVLALNPRTTVRDALKRLRALRDKRIHRIFLIDIDQRLLGSLSIRDLALAEPSSTLEQLDLAAPIGVQAMASHEEVVEILAAPARPACPSSISTAGCSACCATTHWSRRLERTPRPTSRAWSAPARKSGRSPRSASRFASGSRGCRSTWRRPFWPLRSSACSRRRSLAIRRWRCCCPSWPDSRATPAPRRWP